MFIEPRRESTDVTLGARESHGNTDGSHFAFGRMFFALKKSERAQMFVIEEVFGREHRRHRKISGAEQFYPFSGRSFGDDLGQQAVQLINLSASQRRVGHPRIGG